MASPNIIIQGSIGTAGTGLIPYSLPDGSLCSQYISINPSELLSIQLQSNVGVSTWNVGIQGTDDNWVNFPSTSLVYNSSLNKYTLQMPAGSSPWLQLLGYPNGSLILYSQVNSGKTNGTDNPSLTLIFKIAFSTDGYIRVAVGETFEQDSRVGYVGSINAGLVNAAAIITALEAYAPGGTLTEELLALQENVATLNTEIAALQSMGYGSESYRPNDTLTTNSLLMWYKCNGIYSFEGYISISDSIYEKPANLSKLGPGTWFQANADHPVGILPHDLTAVIEKPYGSGINLCCFANGSGEGIICTVLEAYNSFFTPITTAISSTSCSVVSMIFKPEAFINTGNAVPSIQYFPIIGLYGDGNRSSSGTYNFIEASIGIGPVPSSTNNGFQSSYNIYSGYGNSNTINDSALQSPSTFNSGEVINLVLVFSLVSSVYYMHMYVNGQDCGTTSVPFNIYTLLSNSTTVLAAGPMIIGTYGTFNSSFRIYDIRFYNSVQSSNITALVQELASAT